MKKTVILLLAAFILLCSCNKGEDAASVFSEISTDYESKARDALEEYEYSFGESDIYAESESVTAESADFSELESFSESSFEDSDITSDNISESSGTESGDYSDESYTKENRGKVFLVTADVAYEDGTAATLVCTAEGDVDLYYANGTEFTDMGEKSDCREKGMKLIDTCQKYVSEAESVKEYPFPESGNTYVYIKTDSGVFRIAYDNTEIHMGAEGDIEICIINSIFTITSYAEE